VIKRITFATRVRGESRRGRAFLWRDALERASAAPPDVRPVRVTACTTIADLTEADPKHDAVGLEWFPDEARLERFEAWLGREKIARDEGPVVVADEVVMRGEDWLEQRWLRGGDKLKHMAIAVRAENLSPEQFSERWRSHAGRVGRVDAPALVIPDEARGRAYLQNHPRSRPAVEPSYDAVNEVYFDDVEGLRTRVDWFRANFDPDGEDFVRASWFLAVREEVLYAARP
jgi:hypothetical protein